MSRRILLVDDDPAVSRMLLRVLDEENYFVRAVRSGREAMDAALEEPFDLVLFDINIPNEHGGEICERLMAAHADRPVIVMSARSNQRPWVMPAGVRAFLEKPLDIPKLLKTIRVLLDGTSERDPGEAKQLFERR